MNLLTQLLVNLPFGSSISLPVVSPSLVQGLQFKKTSLKFRGGDGLEERPYAELGLLSKGVQFKEPVVSGSGLELGLKIPMMVTAPSSPLVSLEDLD